MELPELQLILFHGANNLEIEKNIENAGCTPLGEGEANMADGYCRLL